MRGFEGEEPSAPNGRWGKGKEAEYGGTGTTTGATAAAVRSWRTYERTRADDAGR